MDSQGRELKKSFFALLSAVLLIGCTSNERVAKLINGYATGVQFNSELVPVSQEVFAIPCGKERFPVVSSGSTINAKAAGENTANVELNIDLLLSEARFEGQTEERLKCNFQAVYRFDENTLRLQGAPTISNCDVVDYRCTFAGQDISCENLRAILSKYKCND